jgi:hypothetical protein
MLCLAAAADIARCCPGDAAHPMYRVGSQGASRAIVIGQRAPNGFVQLQDVASHAELEPIVRDYQKLAGFDRDSVRKVRHS